MPRPTSNMTRRTLISRGALALVAAVLPAARLRAEVSLENLTTEIPTK